MEGRKIGAVDARDGHERRESAFRTTHNTKESEGGLREWKKKARGERQGDLYAISHIRRWLVIV